MGANPGGGGNPADFSHGVDGYRHELTGSPSQRATTTALMQLLWGKSMRGILACARRMLKKPAPFKGQQVVFPGQSGRFVQIGPPKKGGMGQIYRARDLVLNRDVAIKRILPERATDEEALSRFRHEAVSQAEVSTIPGIVPLLDTGEDEIGPFLVLGWIDGQSLAERQDYREKVMDWRMAAEYVSQVCEAMHRLHQRKLYHRDLHPGNILIDTANRAWVCDFGVMRRDKQARELWARPYANGMLGVVQFISPEQERDPRLADARSDIWSLGATLHYLVTGCSAKGIRKDRIPVELQGVIMKATEEHAKDRFADMLEFHQALSDALASCVQTPSRGHATLPKRLKIEASAASARPVWMLSAPPSPRDQASRSQRLFENLRWGGRWVSRGTIALICIYVCYAFFVIASREFARTVSKLRQATASKVQNPIGNLRQKNAAVYIAKVELPTATPRVGSMIPVNIVNGDWDEECDFEYSLDSGPWQIIKGGERYQIPVDIWELEELKRYREFSGRKSWTDDEPNTDPGSQHIKMVWVTGAQTVIGPIREGNGEMRVRVRGADEFVTRSWTAVSPSPPVIDSVSGGFSVDRLDFYVEIKASDPDEDDLRHMYRVCGGDSPWVPCSESLRISAKEAPQAIEVRVVDSAGLSSESLRCELTRNGYRLSK